MRLVRSGMTALVLSLLTFVLTGAGPARALDPVNQSFFGTAVKGYDVVAYFLDGKPVAGSADFEHEWNGASWRFASAKHRDLFAADPERYAPQYGGYCAYAVSQEGTAPIDPQAWRIVDDKLYLNLNPDIQAIWTADIPGFIAKADQNWPKLLGAY